MKNDPVSRKPRLSISYYNQVNNPSTYSVPKTFITLQGSHEQIYRFIQNDPGSTLSILNKTCHKSDGVNKVFLTVLAHLTMSEDKMTDLLAFYNLTGWVDPVRIPYHTISTRTFNGGVSLSETEVVRG